MNELIAGISAGPETLQAIRQRTREVLAAGGLVIFPTETVYGVGGLVTRDDAMDRLDALKQRPAEQPFSVHVPHTAAAERYADLRDPRVQRLLRKVWPGPVTVVVDVPADVQREKAEAMGLGESARRRIYSPGGVALRCPDHPAARAVLESVDAPVAASSANRRGDAPPHEVDAAVAAVGEAADLVVDGGRSRYAKASTVVRLSSESGGPMRMSVLREGVYDQRFLQKLMTFRLLLVCSGNTCRSPMAEAIAKKLIADRLGVAPDRLGEHDISVRSAGVYALQGAAATPEAVTGAASVGASLQGHRARTLTLDMIHEADLVLCMTESHRASVLGMAPDAAHRVQTVDPHGDIDDPIGSGPEVYQSTARRLETLLRSRIQEWIA